MIKPGIDIGGTKAVIALIGENKEIIDHIRFFTGSQKSCQTIMYEAADSLLSLWHKHALPLEILNYVGIGVPGTVDPLGITVINAPNLNWTDEPAGKYFSLRSGISCSLVQDTRAAALAESTTDQMKNCHLISCVTLGTGIGCGIVQNGKIFHGASGTAGEIGHIPVVYNGRLCGCGRRGCMEAYASGTGIALSSQKQGIASTCEETFEKALSGDFTALKVIDEAVTFAAMGVSAMVNVLSPDAVLFSGGLSQQKELYLNPLIEKIKTIAYQPAIFQKIYFGEAFLGSDAPVIGASLLKENSL